MRLDINDTVRPPIGRRHLQTFAGLAVISDGIGHCTLLEPIDIAKAEVLQSTFGTRRTGTHQTLASLVPVIRQ